MILIAEDQLITALELKQILHRNGYPEARIFTKGSEAIEFLADCDLLFALLDIKLADNISGLEIARRLKMKDTPFIFISAFSDPENLRRAKELNPAGIITKPLDESELELLIQNIN